MTEIPWADQTWNPVTGCTPASAGCLNCYAKRMRRRQYFMGVEPSPDFGQISYHPDRLNQPFSWKKPRRVFVCSMGDLFHDRVLEDYIERVYAVMARCDRHRFMVLTKRPARLVRLADKLPMMPHIWHGVTVEAQEQIERIDLLGKLPAQVTKFISAEPLLGPLNFAGRWSAIDWIITGAESGPGARCAEVEWVQGIRNQCLNVVPRVPFFFKGWGGRSQKAGGRILDGREWKQEPAR